MQESCAEREFTIIKVDCDEKTTPLGDRAASYTWCMPCDVLLHYSIEMMHEKSFFKEMEGKGKGRGRQKDTKMSFRDFWKCTFGDLNLDTCNFLLKNSFMSWTFVTELL